MHLNDEQIQRYLDDGNPEQAASIAAHLETCERCQEAVRQYRSLYLALSRDLDFDLPLDFADTVLHASRMESSRPRLSDSLLLFLALLGICLAAWATYHVMGVTGFADTLLAPMKLLAETCISLYTAFFAMVGGAYYVVLYAAAILALIGALDWLLTQHRHRSLFP